MSAVDRRSPEAATWRPLYSTPRWRSLRRAQLNASPLCEMDHGGRLVPATVVNHRIPHKGDLALFFNPSNLQSVCKPCHDGPIQRAELKGYSTAVDAHGYPTDAYHPANRRRRHAPTSPQR